MKRLLIAIWCAAALVAAPQQADDIALQAAIQKEVVDGDLPAALKAYEALSHSSNRVVAARALVRMGRCYERTGDSKAAAAYQRVVNEFKDQDMAVQQASARLAVLAKAAQEAEAHTRGWYNGDWQSGIPGLANWYISEEEFSRVYDDFIVPERGWTITAVFSNNRMDFSGVTHAVWEIREMVGGNGKRVAGGLSRATQTVIPGNGPFPRDPLVGYRVEVSGLNVQLPRGRYWLNVAPVGMGKSYASATRGRNAIGNPPGNDGMAILRSSETESFVGADTVGSAGQLGVARDFSMGVIIAPGK